MVISSVKIAAFSTGPFIFFSQERSRVNSHVDNVSFDTQYNNLQLDGNTRPVVTRMITIMFFFLFLAFWIKLYAQHECEGKGNFLWLCYFIVQNSFIVWRHYHLETIIFSVTSSVFIGPENRWLSIQLSHCWYRPGTRRLQRLTPCTENYYCTLTFAKYYWFVYHYHPCSLLLLFSSQKMSSGFQSVLNH